MRKSTNDTRTAILKVALQLFLQKGYKNVSYQELVKKTGLSKGAIYHYFESKEVLLIAVFELFLEVNMQSLITEPENMVKDRKSFEKFYVDTKIEQLNDFKIFLETETVNFNWLLFFLEAINENEQLKSIIVELSKQEIKFLEKCFLGLKKHDKLPEGKNPALLAESLYFMLEGAGMIMFLVENKGDEDFIKMYSKTIEGFFKII